MVITEATRPAVTLQPAPPISHWQLAVSQTNPDPSPKTNLGLICARPRSSAAEIGGQP